MSEAIKNEYSVYCLLQGEVIVYVGITKNLPKRLAQHKYSKKDFDGHKVLAEGLSGESALNIENDYIKKLKPLYNIRGKKSHRIRLTTMLNPELKTRLKIQAISKGVTPADLLEEMIQEYLSTAK